MFIYFGDLLLSLLPPLKGSIKHTLRKEKLQTQDKGTQKNPAGKTYSVRRDETPSSPLYGVTEAASGTGRTTYGTYVCGTEPERTRPDRSTKIRFENGRRLSRASLDDSRDANSGSGDRIDSRSVRAESQGNGLRKNSDLVTLYDPACCGKTKSSRRPCLSHSQDHSPRVGSHPSSAPEDEPRS